MNAGEVINTALDSAERGQADGEGNVNTDKVTGQSEHSESRKPDVNNENFIIDTKKEFEIDNSQVVVDNKQTTEVRNSEVVIKTTRPLCADYRSDSDSESDDSDSESDSSTSSDEYTSETTSDSEDDSTESDDSETLNPKPKKSDRKLKTDFSLLDLPPIEDLKISVPEDACIEIGTVTSVVETLVVVESFKGTPALDVDTVLFLDRGKRTLGKVFDILGPVTEPIYAVRFNTQEQIKSLEIEKGLKVYCAPKTQHTSFVFLSEVMKHKGSDASWKDNIEAPSEFQDFSDDEEERRHRMDKNSNEDGSRKRPLNKSTNVVQPGRFRPVNPQPRPNRFPNTHHRPFVRSPHQVPMQPFQYNVPVYPGNAVLTGGPPLPHMYFPPRFSGPPFPTFAFGQRIPQPFYQQRTHSFGEGWRFVAPPPPPPPPPTASEGGHKPPGQS